MREFLVEIFNHRFMFTLFLIILIIGGVVLFQDGVQIADAVVITVISLLYLALWRFLLTHQTSKIISVQDFENALRNNSRPTLAQFFSPHCAGCAAVKPLVDQLEQEVGNRLQIIRLNIDLEPGKSLMAGYSVLFTPTFIYFDKAGTKIQDSIFILDRARILNDLERP